MWASSAGEPGGSPSRTQWLFHVLPGLHAHALSVDLCAAIYAYTQLTSCAWGYGVRLIFGSTTGRSVNVLLLSELLSEAHRAVLKGISGNSECSFGTSGTNLSS